MRLIDAEELHEILNWTMLKPPFSKKQVRRFIDDTRTVEAIPIEWIESQVDKGKWAELVQRWAERKEE